MGDIIIYGCAGVSESNIFSKLISQRLMGPGYRKHVPPAFKILSMITFDQMVVFGGLFNTFTIFQKVIENAFARDLGGIIHFCV